MLETVNAITDEIAQRLYEDPVRPHIPHARRVEDHREIFALRDDQGVAAVTCVSYLDDVPAAEEDLFDDVADTGSVVAFYTIWSYRRGAGRDLLNAAVQHIKSTKPNITRFVTLSPKTEMARKFHIENGAVVFRENAATINYEYK